eukprot:m.33273 g.33273  ORF g.33273 m.33273 type:complete len:71 (-) comp16787_c0_seq1:229-441(-)
MDDEESTMEGGPDDPLFMMLARILSFSVAIAVVLLVVTKAPSNYGPSIAVQPGTEVDIDDDQSVEPKKKK